MVKINNRFILLLALVFVILISLSFISALGTVTWLSPINFGNYTTDMNLSIEMSATDAINATDREYNVSFYYNASGGEVDATSGLLITISNTSADQYLFENSSVVITGLTDGLSIYNISVLADNTTDKVWFVGAFNVTIDNTAPNVSSIIEPLNNDNVSSSILLNFTVVDATIGMDNYSVYFNLTSGGVEKNFSQATQQGTSEYWNFTLDTSSYSDGKYNLTVYANDTLNNLNSTEYVEIIIDNTAPSVTLTKYSSTSDTIKTSLAASDATTGVNGTCTVDRSGASISTAGTLVTETGLSCGTSYTYTVTCTDYTAQSGSGSLSLSTDSCGGSLTGAGVSVPSKSYSISEEQFTTGATKEMAVNEKTKFSVDGKSHQIEVSEVTADKVKIKVSSEPQEATLSIGDEKKFEVSGDSFYDIYVKLNSITGTKASLTFKSIKEEIPITPTEEAPTEEAPPTPTEEVKEEKPSLGWVWIIIIVVIVVIVILVVVVKRRK